MGSTTGGWQLIDSTSAPDKAIEGCMGDSKQ